MNEIHTQQALTVTASKAIDNNKPSQLQAKDVEANDPSSQAAATTDKADSNNEATANPLNEQQVEQAVAKLNDYVQQSQRKLEFKVDDDSGQTVVRVFNKGSDELIRQIPNEEALELAKRLSLEEPLVLFSAQV